MITIDYKPVLSLPYLSKIVFTDCAESERSIVFMDKDDAPRRETLVWVLIRNLDYDPNDPLNDTDIDGVTTESNPIQEHASNPYYLFKRWMWVEAVLSPEFPANYLTDEEGDPLTDESGNLVLGDWDNRPGMVKVHLREHKHALTRQAILDNVNIIHRLPSIVTGKLR